MNIKPKYFLGNDPDSKHNAFALLDLKGNVVDAWTISSKNSSELTQIRSHLATKSEDHPLLKEPFIAIVEGQKVYPPKNGKFDAKSNPDSQIKLARASGIGSYWIGSQIGCEEIQIVLPKDWKGQKKKGPHQMMIWKSLGIKATLRASNTYACPDEFMGMKLTQLKHVTDAIGLAQYGLDQYLWKARKEQIKNGYT